MEEAEELKSSDGNASCLLASVTMSAIAPQGLLFWIIMVATATTPHNISRGNTRINYTNLKLAGRCYVWLVYSLNRRDGNPVTPGRSLLERQQIWPQVSVIRLLRWMNGSTTWSSTSPFNPSSQLFHAFGPTVNDSHNQNQLPRWVLRSCRSLGPPWIRRSCLSDGNTHAEIIVPEQAKCFCHTAGESTKGTVWWFVFDMLT